MTDHIDEHDDIASEEPEIFSIAREDKRWNISRRSFLSSLAATVAATAVGSVVTGCGSGSNRAGDNGGSQSVSPMGDPTAVFAHASTISSFAFTHDSKMLFSSDGYQIKAWSLPSGAFITAIPNSSNMEILSISPDNQFMLCGDSNGVITKWVISNIWNCSSTTLLNSDVPFYTYTISPDLETVIALDKNLNLQVYSLQTGQLMKTLVENYSSVISGWGSYKSSPEGTGIYFIKNSDYILFKREAYYANSDNVTYHVENVFDLLSLIDGTITTSTRLFYDSMAYDYSNKLFYTHEITDDYAYVNSAYSIPSFQLVRRIPCVCNDLESISDDGTLLLSNDHSVFSLPTFSKIYTFPTPDPDNIVNNSMHGVSVEINCLGKFSANNTSIALSCGGYGRGILLWSHQQRKFLAILMDVAASLSAAHGMTYTCTDSTGTVHTYTLPCGSPLPADASCVCNCVQGTGTPTDPGGGGGGGGGCSYHCGCNTVWSYYYPS